MRVGVVLSKVGLTSAKISQRSLANEIALRRATMSGLLVMLCAARRLAQLLEPPRSA